MLNMKNKQLIHLLISKDSLISTLIKQGSNILIIFRVEKYSIPEEDLQKAQQEIPTELRDVSDEYETELLNDFNKKHLKKSKKKRLTEEDR